MVIIIALTLLIISSVAFGMQMERQCQLSSRPPSSP
jgi:hypothetical protein